MINRIIHFFLYNRLVTVLLAVGLIAWGLAVAPFDIAPDFLPRNRVAVDAIPNLGENQQIVYTEWMGRSPQDVEDQVTYPLTTSLLGIPGVESIRSSSMFGVSIIYIIFEEEVEFYWSRSRILEKLNSLSPGTIPDGVQPSLGPDATALGQIYWYTLEGRNPETGEPAGGWDPQELRTVQDFYVKYGLNATKGVSEVAGVGGFVKEYQVDLDPQAMNAHGVTIEQVMQAVKSANKEVGARTLEYNRVEYLVRGLGYIDSLSDLENAPVKVSEHTSIRVKDVAHVTMGPAPRRGGLDKQGQEAVGGVVVARYGSNPMQVIERVKEKIDEISPGLPSKTLEDGTISKVTIVPFYDRSGLINETLGTLEEALNLQVLISTIVVLILVLNLRASLLISGLLPFGVLITFITMQLFGVTANIVALSGIAIAIGVMIDVGVIITENIVQHLNFPENVGAKGKKLLEVIYAATAEVSSAVLTALATTVISFLPVFTLQDAEGKLFRPLAFTKTFALIAALIIGLIIIPTFAHFLFSLKAGKPAAKKAWNILLAIAGIVLIFFMPAAGWLLLALAIANLLEFRVPSRHQWWYEYIAPLLIVISVAWLLADVWLPLGPATNQLGNFLFVAVLLVIIMGTLMVVIRFYEPMLRFFLHHKVIFLGFTLFVLLFGFMSWKGFDAVFGFVADGSKKVGIELRETKLWAKATKTFPKLGEEFMPPLNEGSYLLMPTTMPHSGVEENVEVIQQLDRMVYSIPEVSNVVGKWGRVNSALDPAPISMFENIVNYKSEYKLDKNGRRIRFKVDEEGAFVRDKQGELIPDKNGQYFRNWRDHIKSPDDIWAEIEKATQIPGLTSAPKLQPIQTRQIMLSTGMRAPMGVKLYGPDLASLEKAGAMMEKTLKEVSSIKASSVFADRVVGKPYLEIKIDRNEITRYGLSIENVQRAIQAGIGGMAMTTTVEGRERYDVRVRYGRGYREEPDKLDELLISTPKGAQIPLKEIAEVTYRRGPQMIKSENTFLTAYVIFEPVDGAAEVDVVHEAQALLDKKQKDESMLLPPNVSYRFAGNYENQVRAEKRLALVIPISLLMIFLLLYFQFKDVSTTLMAFSGIAVAFAGGFILLWLYGQGWFLDFNVADQSFREMFQMKEIKLSVAIWVGFIALFGVATDNGVLLGTFLKDSFRSNKTTNKQEIRDAVIEAGNRRIRPAMMTTATTIIALLPVLSSTGKGSDIMVPMAIPTFGGMIFQVLTVFLVPVLFSLWKEQKLTDGPNIIEKMKKLIPSKIKKLLVLGLMATASISVYGQSTLAEYQQLGAEQNEGLKARFKEYHAALEQVNQQNALPDPNLMFGYFIQPIETRVGPQIAKFSVTQLFPWFGTLSAREEVAATKAKAKYQAFVAARDELYFSIERTWNQMYVLQESIVLTDKNIRFVQSYRQVAEAKSSSGKTSLVDVLRADMELERLNEQLATLNDRKTPLISQFRALLSDSTVSPEMPDTLIADSMETATAVLFDSLRQHNPLLQQLRDQQEAWRQQDEVSRKMGYPNLSLGLDYIITGKRDDMNMPDNGKDAIVPRVGVTIPIFRKKYKAMRAEARLMEEAVGHNLNDQQQRFQAQLEEALQQYREAVRKIELYRREVQLARQALSILTTSYTSGGKDFEELLRMERQLLDYQLKTAKAIADQNTTVATIKRLIGSTTLSTPKN